MKPYNLLFVEDEVDIQKVVELYLKEHPSIIYHIVNTGEEALQLIDNNEIDIIVTDFILGTGINGAELLEKVKKLKPNIFRYLLTGVIDNKLIQEAKLRAEPVRIFEKPLIIEDIISEITQKLS
ncbi:MAG: response regulator [Candidatus Heimdallarchaeota archaeon]|nr:response regulator [Candidatus Heimdallarchaeota archaeon]MDH5645292.1 response regulator [Candidatus Heimdallarchaeota archaeon]